MQQLADREVAPVALLARRHVLPVEPVAGAPLRHVLLARPGPLVVEQRAHDAAPRLDLEPKGRELGVGLREAGHVEGLTVASQKVGRDGLVRPRGEAVLALDPAQEVLREAPVVAVAQPVAPRVRRVGVGDLVGEEPRGDLAPPRLVAVVLEPQRRDGLERHRAQPLERLGELAPPVRPETARLLRLPGRLRGAGGGLFIRISLSIL